MRALITGITGFVGKHLEKQLIAEGAEVFGTSRNSFIQNRCYQIDLLNKENIIKLLNEVKPTHIFHLAGISNVKNSWTDISKTIEVNTMATVNLLEAIYKVDNGIRVLTIGSSEEYGKVINIDKKITEETGIRPVTPYGISKATISMLIKQFQQGYGLDIIHLRPFNHIGPGQKLGFVTSDFAYQIALINKGVTNTNKIIVGNLEAVRDFTDVRDIVKAYYLIALHGKAGEIYNVCSGKGIKVQKILEVLLSFSKNKKINIEIDPEKNRPSDLPYYVGDYKKLNQITNWEPMISLKKSLNDIYNYWYLLQ
jgi:GDP-4-dehydro-6-deoxy-D-mannose reductase